MSAAAVAGLRWWAQGVPADEAAVELLAGCLPGRYTRAGCPWVRPCRRPGWYWLDPEPLARLGWPLSVDERRIVALVVALLRDQPALRGQPASSVHHESGRAAA